MEQNHFDKKIKASLENLEVPFNAAHWQRMEEALGKPTLPKVADAAAFDALISGKLENLEAKKLPDWQRMAAALDGIGISNREFDQEVKTKVKYIKPTYQPSHWELLAERLRREKAIKESLYKNKISEITLLILLLLNFYQYAPDFTPKKILPDTQFIPQASLEAAIPLVEPLIENTQNNSIAQQPAKTIKQKQITSIRTASSSDATKKSEDNVADNFLYISSTLPSINIDKEHLSQYNRQQVLFGIDGKTGLTITVPEMTKHLDHVGLSNSGFVKTLPSLTPPSLATATITPLDCEKCKKYRIPAQFRFGMVSHIGLTDAVRSADQLLDVSALAQKGGGYGSGFSLGFKYGRYEIETGLIYAAKNYDPDIVDPYGSLGGVINQKRFTGISLQTLRLPLNLRYNYAVLGSGKLHLYAQNGVAMNIILVAEYDITNRLQPTNRSIQGVAATSRLSRITFNQGIFGGDPLKENRFFTVNLGAGAEYYLSPKWSVFMQPDFHYYISQFRIGPTKDRINSLSISFGVKASFY